jgi:hypothetical protein
MFLRDLIFGRKVQQRPAPPLVKAAADPSGPEAAGDAVAPASGLDTAALQSLLPDQGGPDGAASGQPSHASETRVVGVLAEEAPATPRPVSRPLPPVLGLMIGGAVPAEDRQRTIVDELSRALSLREISLVGTDRSARMLVANRRLLSVDFTGCGPDAGFDMRRDLPDQGQALAVLQAFADLVSAPVDLMVEARHAAGVYAADGGLPVDLLVGGADAVCAAYRAPEVEEPELEPADRTVA